MAKCKDCIHFPICKPHTDPNESYPEVGGCPAFKSKDAFVEVVRCKDCKHYKPRNQSAQWEQTTPCCLRSAALKFPAEGFCSYGERRECNVE